MSLGLGLGLGLSRARGGGAKLDPAKALADWVAKVESIAGGTVGETDAVATLIATLMTNGIWQKLDYLTIANASSVASLVNLVNPSIVSTALNTITFEQYLGFRSGDATGYIDTNVNLTTTKNYAGGTGTMGVYFGQKVNVSLATYGFIGSMESTSAKRNHLSQTVSLGPPMRPAFAYLYYNAPGNRIEGATNPDKYLACTNNANADWVLIQEATPTRIVQSNNGFDANALFNGNVYMCGVNINGVLSGAFNVGANNGLIGSGIIGGYLSSSGANPEVVAGEHLILKNALDTYYAAVKP